MIKIRLNKQTRIIRNIRFQDKFHLDAEYRGWQISIFPMYGKLVAGRYCDNIRTGEFGVDVAGRNGCRIVDSVVGSVQEGIEQAIENILLCRPQYER